MDNAENVVAPEEIGVDFTPRRAKVGAEAVVGDEILLATEPFQPCHRLNSSAAYLWDSFDGETPLSAVVAELSKMSGMAEEVLAGDVIAFARHLGGMGLLEGVAPSEAEPPTPVELPVPGVGEKLEDFDLPDQGGTVRQWSSFRGRRTLLVNWSPYCGYCLQIAGALGELRPGLEREGVQLAFVTAGGPEANLAVFEEASLADTPILHKQDGVDPFAGLGTPAALAFDEDGKVVEKLAYGALDVPVLAARLAGIEEEDGDSASHARYLGGGGGACAPGALSVKAKSSQWSGMAVYGIGEFHVGIRSDSPGTEVFLDRLLPGVRVEDRRARPDFSVALPDLGAAASSGPQGLDLLVRDDLQVVRSRSAGRVLRGLLGYLSMELYNPDKALLQIDGIAVVGAGRAHILPSMLYQMFSIAQPRLGLIGLQVIDRPRVLLDPATAEVVVAEPVVPHDPTVLDELDRDSPDGSKLPEVTPGRYPLAGWVMADDDHPAGSLAPASAAGMAVGLVTWVPSLQKVLDDLVGIFASVRAHTLPYEGVDDFLRLLPAALA